MTRIFKFGGASVKDASAIRNLAHIIDAEQYQRLVVVVSAMGKTTVALEKITNLAFKGLQYEDELSAIIHYHYKVASDLSIDPARLEILTDKLREVLSFPDDLYYRKMDAVLAFGELMSTAIIANFLSQTHKVLWVDARELIRTSDDYGEARVDWEITSLLVAEKLTVDSPSIFVTQGFIGQSHRQYTTTLGKEGSDFTAAILANILEANDMTVWKDVPGIMNADPKLMESAKMFDVLSYEEITEMTYYGAKVIHPKTIVPLAQKNIPLRVRSFGSPEDKGTTIASSDRVERKLPIFIYKFSQYLVTLRVKDNSFMDEKKLVNIFHVLDIHNVKLNLMQMSALTFTFCFDAHEEKLEKIQEKFIHQFRFTYNDDLQLATIKNYSNDAMNLLPPYSELIIEQKSRSVYHRLFR